jgi:hypothetical protein
MRRLWEALARFWQRDESLSVLLGLLVFFEFVLPPLLPAERSGGVVKHVVFSLLLVAGATTVLRQGRWAVRTAAGLTLAALPIRWASWAAPGDTVAAWSAATAAVALALLALVVVQMVLRPGTITSRRIEGAVAGYLLLALAWSGAYECVALLDPAAFAGSGAGGSRQWIYYSLVTLTTMGYGDITPVHPVARSLATAEALTGQMYIAILISRLVALELQAREGR